jgi:hypothetical protein
VSSWGVKRYHGSGAMECLGGSICRKLLNLFVLRLFPQLQNELESGSFTQRTERSGAYDK